MKLTLTVNQRQLDDAAGVLGDLTKGIKGAMVRAINRALDQTSTAVSRVVRANYNLADKAVKGAISIRRPYAKQDLYSGALIVSGREFPLYKFSPKPSVPTAKRPPVGVSVLVRRTSPRWRVPGGFIAIMKSGHIGVFQRERGTRNRAGTGEAIAEKFGISVPGVLEVPKVWEEIEAQAQARLDARVTHELDQLLKRKG